VTKYRQKLTILDVFHEEPRGWTQVASNTSLHGDEMTRQMSASRGSGEFTGEVRRQVWANFTNILSPNLPEGDWA
jgi:hypothetical protein